MADDVQLDEPEIVAQELRAVGEAFAEFLARRERALAREQQEVHAAIREAEERRVEEIRQTLSSDET